VQEGYLPFLIQVADITMSDARITVYPEEEGMYIAAVDFAEGFDAQKIAAENKAIFAEHAAAERITGNTGIRSIAVIQDLGKVNNSVIAYFIGGLPAAVIILIDALVVRQILDHVVKCRCIAQADAAILNALSADLAAQQRTKAKALTGGMPSRVNRASVPFVTVSWVI
jgi:hypothetical protein